jgi:hypothetical protein
MSRLFDDYAFDTGDGPAPPGGVRFVPFIRPHGGIPLFFIATAQQITPRWVHWTDGRTVGCRGQYGLPCQPCDAGGRRRWTAFLPVLLWPGCSEAIVDLPQSAFFHGRESNPAFHGNLRGRWFMVKRPVRPSTPWIVEIRESGEGVPDPLPAPPDVPALLRRLWGLPEWVRMRSHVHRPRDGRFGA